MDEKHMDYISSSHNETQQSSEKGDDEVAQRYVDPELDRATLRRLDFYIVPIVCVMYLLAFLDRANVGNARVAGLQSDLGITDIQYQTAITVTYVPYILTELPSNLVLKKIGPRILLPCMMLGWGIVTTLQSQIHSYAGLLACRFFLGFCEGGLTPGIVLYLSGLYRPKELQLRISLFFSAAALSSAFSGLLAAGIQQMDGLGGMKGWQWIFLLEGLFTVCFASFCFWALPNGPRDVRSFRAEHKEHCTYRLTLDRNAAETHPVTWREMFSTFTDLHTWLVCVSQFCSGTSLYGLAYFSPSIVETLGFNSTVTQLLTVPPFVLAFIVGLLSAWLADRYQRRSLSGICTTILAVIGFALFKTANGSLGQKYTSLCFLVTGIYSTAPSMLVSISNNTAGHTRRATALAFSFILTNSGGILSTWIYPKSDAPNYEFAANLNLALSAVTVALIAANWAWLVRQNRRKVTHRDQILKKVDGCTEEEQRRWLGDRHPDFIYTY